MNLQQFQMDVAAQIASMPLAANVPVFVFRPRAAMTGVQIQSRIDSALGPLTAVTGKAGMAVQVLMPNLDIEPDKQELPGPFLRIQCTIRVQENPMVNMGANGTQVACEDFAIGVTGALHLWTPGGVSGIVRCAHDAVVPNLKFEPLVSYDINIESEPAFIYPPQTSVPIIASNAGQVTLTSVSANAAIYFTLDGTTPYPARGEIVTTAQLYTGAIPIPAAGTMLRAAAFSQGMRGSDIVFSQF